MLVRPRTRVLCLVVTLLTVASLALPAGADDLETLQERREGVAAEIERVTADLDDLKARILATEDEISTLHRRLRELEEQAEEASVTLTERARSAFMRGGESFPLESLLSADGPTAAVERAGMVAVLSRRDVAALESAVALRQSMEQTSVLLASRKEELTAMRAEMEERGAALQARFQQVSAQYQELKTRRDRQRTLERGQQRGVYACIFQGPHHFRNTWGDPRSGGRRHKGTDVMAPHRAPVYAFTNGRIGRYSNSRLGGVGLYLTGDDGMRYFYAHLDGYADGLYPGKRVEAGELIAYNGYTGNADASAPHVHFEVHPGGGAPVNPYPWLRAVCP